MYPKIRQYPKTVRVCGVVWTVQFVQVIPDEDSKIVGLCWFDEKIIYIKLGQGPRERFQTFLHECLHAIHFSLGIKLDPEMHAWIYQIEEGFADFFIDNFIPMCGMALSAIK